MIKFIILVLIFTLSFIKTTPSYASHTSEQSVITLQNKISNNFSGKYCNSIEKGFSKDEAMRSAIIDTENIVAFSINPQKKMIMKEDLADQISIKVVNKCGWVFGLIDKEGVDYFKRYFLEINEKTTPNKKLSG